MKHNETKTETMISLRKWSRDLGISDTTAWRWTKAGLIHPINIYGKLYLTGEDVRQFATRAKAGEFSQPSAGCTARPGICPNCKKKSVSFDNRPQQANGDRTNAHCKACGWRGSRRIAPNDYAPTPKLGVPITVAYDLPADGRKA